MAEEQTVPKGMIILGSAGAGKTTLGKLTAEKLGITFLDIDEYIWRNDTDIPYTVMYSKDEKIKRIMDAVEEAVSLNNLPKLDDSKIRRNQ